METEYTDHESAERRTPMDRITLTLAKVQGSWNEKTKQTLKANLAQQMHIDTTDATPPEKIFAGMITGAVNVFYGEGSIARLIVGHPVSLSEEDRGLIILRELVNHDPQPSEWETAAVLSAEIASGNTFKKISSRLDRGIKGFFWTVKKGMGLLKKLHPDEGDEIGDGDDLNEIEENMLNKIYGGSDAALLENKTRFRQKILFDLKEQLSTMNHEELVSLIHKLKTQTSDVVLDSSLNSAIAILTDIHKSQAQT